MIQKQTLRIEGYRGLYLERSGESTRDLVEVLLEPPEVDLSTDEKAEVYSFEAAISTYELQEGIDVEIMINSQKGEDSNAPLFFAESFLDGSVTLDPLGNPEFHSHEDVYAWIAKAIKDKTVDTDLLIDAAKQSTLGYKKKITSALLASEEVSDEILDSMSLVVSPEDIVEQTKNAEQARQFLLDLRKQYKEGGDPVDGAKRAVVDVYLARVNEVIAKYIPTVDYFLHQSRMIGDELGIEAARSALTPAVRSILDNDEKRQSLFRRLDYLRNGLGINDQGESTPISSEVLSIGNNARDASAEKEGVFTPEQTEVLKRTMLEPNEMVNIFSRVIAKAGMLSAEDGSTLMLKRHERAHDNLFQVVKNPTKATFEVDGIRGVYKVASEPRSIYDAMVVGGFHELRHIDQAEADRLLGETLRIGVIKGKRPSMIREGGANMKQREAELIYFGKSKPMALTYACALQALENGGNLFAATRAFYEEKRHIMPEVSPADAAKEAADRVLRLIRQGGHSSQAMVYAEEGILSQELADTDPALKERAMAITGLDLVDQVRLHKYGLLPEIPKSDMGWSELVMQEFEPYIRNALQAA